jgi:hypothetical protein
VWGARAWTCVPLPHVLPMLPDTLSQATSAGSACSTRGTFKHGGQRVE